MHILIVIAVFGVLKGAGATLCYTCSNINTKSDCFTFTECPANEMCYTSALGLHTGGVKYNVGCTHNMKPASINASSSIEFCTEYCHGDFCNLGKCGMPDDTTRTTRCLSCDLVSNPRECKHMVHCQDSQICFIRKVNIFGADKYRLGCMDKMHCRNSTGPASIGLQVLGKRSVRDSPDTNCSLCCTTDYCNSQYCSDIPSNVSVPLQLMTDSTSCTEPQACLAIGHLSDDACLQPDIDALCPGSCGICGHFGWNGWGPWSSCSGTCGQDTVKRTRTRTCIHQLSVTNKTLCPGASLETLPCAVVNGGWSQWGNWGQCSPSIWDGRWRFRNCTNPSPLNCGSDCIGTAVMTVSC